MKQRLTIAFQLSQTEDPTYLHIAELLQKDHNEHEVMLISDGKPSASPSQKLRHDFIQPSLSNNLLRRYWYAIKLPKWLEQNECEFFFSAGHRPAANTSVKSIIRLSSPLHCSLKNLRPYLQQAFRVIISNPKLANEMKSSFPEFVEKFAEIPSGLNTTWQAVNHETKTQLLNQHTEGSEYFLAITKKATTEELLLLLRSFSIFKKWQHSEMKLLLVHGKKEDKNFLSKLELYKFRKDVILLQEHELTSDIVSAAYTCILGASKDTEDLSRCMSMGVPVIMSADPYAESDYGDAVAFAPWNEKDISKQMILIYKDENYRSEIISNAGQLLENRSWPLIASKIWDTLLYPSLA